MRLTDADAAPIGAIIAGASSHQQNEREQHGMARLSSRQNGIHGGARVRQCIRVWDHHRYGASMSARDRMPRAIAYILIAVVSAALWALIAFAVIETITRGH